MDVLIARNDGIFDVVHHSEVAIGDEFVHGYDSNSKAPIKRQVVEVIEQRKEKGEYKDENNRRMWAKVKQQIIPQR